MASNNAVQCAKGDGSTHPRGGEKSCSYCQRREAMLRHPAGGVGNLSSAPPVADSAEDGDTIDLRENFGFAGDRDNAPAWELDPESEVRNSQRSYASSRTEMRNGVALDVDILAADRNIARTEYPGRMAYPANGSSAPTYLEQCDISGGQVVIDDSMVRFASLEAVRNSKGDYMPMALMGADIESDDDFHTFREKGPDGAESAVYIYRDKSHGMTVSRVTPREDGSNDLDVQSYVRLPGQGESDDSKWISTTSYNNLSVDAKRAVSDGIKANIPRAEAAYKREKATLDSLKDQASVTSGPTDSSARMDKGILLNTGTSTVVIPFTGRRLTKGTRDELSRKYNVDPESVRVYDDLEVSVGGRFKNNDGTFRPDYYRSVGHSSGSQGLGGPLRIGTV